MKLIFMNLLIILQLLFGQFPSYDISKGNVSNFSSSVKPLIRSTSFSLGYHQLVNNSLKERVSLSIILPLGYDLTNKSFIEYSIVGLPLLHSSLLISNNLRLNGKIGGFTSHNDVINYYSYGFSLGLLLKDVDTCMGMLQDNDLPAPVLRANRELFQLAKKM